MPTVKELAEYVLRELNSAGVKDWTESDHFEGIYAICEFVVGNDTD